MFISRAQPISSVFTCGYGDSWGDRPIVIVLSWARRTRWRHTWMTRPQRKLPSFHRNVVLCTSFLQLKVILSHSTRTTDDDLSMLFRCGLRLTARREKLSPRPRRSWGLIFAMLNNSTANMRQHQLPVPLLPSISLPSALGTSPVTSAFVTSVK